MSNSFTVIESKITERSKCNSSPTFPNDTKIDTKLWYFYPFNNFIQVSRRNYFLNVPRKGEFSRPADAAEFSSSDWLVRSLKTRRRFWQVASIRSPIDLKRGEPSWTRRDVGRCVTCCEPTFKQARPGSTRARGLRLAWREPECFAPSSTGGEETPRRVPWLESTRRSESSPEPGSQAERRLNSTLSIPFILPLTMRGAVGYEPRASPRNSRGRQESSGSKADFSREARECFYGLSVSLKRRQAWRAALENERAGISTKAGSLELIL